MTTPKNADGHSAAVTIKKPKTRQAEFADARRACRNIAEREQLALVLKARWTEAELHEYARLYYFRNGKDYPTASSYRRAIADLAGHYRALQYPGAKPSDYPHGWLKEFRKDGSKPLPPRREGLVKRGRGNGPEVTYEEYAWPHHTEEFRSMIEQQARDYFKIGPEGKLHPNAWAAAHRAYERKQEADEEALRKQREAVEFYLAPKAQKKLPKGHKLAPQTDFNFRWCTETLKPHFNYEFPGHSEAFREEVAALARKGKKPVSPRSWKIACHKHYVLIDGTQSPRGGHPSS